MQSPAAGDEGAGGQLKRHTPEAGPPPREKIIGEQNRKRGRKIVSEILLVTRALNPGMEQVADVEHILFPYAGPPSAWRSPRMGRARAPIAEEERAGT